MSDATDPLGGMSAGALRGRMQLANALGEQFDGDRDLYDTLGYDKEPTVADYRARYYRQDVARAIVDLPANNTWREEPEVTDDEDSETQSSFESDVESLFRDHELLARCEAVDRLAGIGHFGLLILGIADGQELSQPAAGELSGPEDLAYLMPVGEDRVESWTLVEDETHERFGLPETYTIDFARNDAYSESTASDEQLREVHWSRIIHVPAGNTLDNLLFGRPRLEAVYNRLQDLEKVIGAAAEYMWRAADYGLALQADPEYAGQLNDEKMDRLEDELEAWYHGLQPFMRLSGMEVERLGGGEVDPSGIVEQIMKLIAGETGIPQRILTGSERGELASTQDRASWLGRIAERQQNFAEPRIFRPLVERLVDVGIIAAPQDEYDVEWPNLFELSEVERAEVADKLAGALQKTRPAGGAEPVMSQGEVRSIVFDLDPELGAEVDIDENLPDDDLPADITDLLPPEDREPQAPPDELDESDEAVIEQWRRLQDGGTAE